MAPSINYVGREARSRRGLLVTQSPREHVNTKEIKREKRAVIPVECGESTSRSGYTGPPEAVQVLRYLISLIPILQQQLAVALFRLLELQQLRLATFLI